MGNPYLKWMRTGVPPWRAGNPITIIHHILTIIINHILTTIIHHLSTNIHGNPHKAMVMFAPTAPPARITLCLLIDQQRDGDQVRRSGFRVKWWPQLAFQEAVELQSSHLAKIRWFGWCSLCKNFTVSWLTSISNDSCSYKLTSLMIRNMCKLICHNDDSLLVHHGFPTCSSRIYWLPCKLRPQQLPMNHLGPCLASFKATLLEFAIDFFDHLNSSVTWGGFYKWGYPNSWMVYKGKNH